MEITAVVVSAWAIWLTTTRNSLCWPIGIASVVLYTVVFYRARLYSDCLLQILYAAFNAYGWWVWLRAPKAEGKPKVLRPRTRNALGHLLAGGAGAAVLGALMAHFTDAAVPWLDASLTAFSLVAQYWMARLYAINWLLWITVDVVYIGLYVQRDLAPTGALYAGFVVLAILGWRRWQAAATESVR